MSSILKVDQIQLANGNTPTAKDLGVSDAGNIINIHRTNYNTAINPSTANWVDSGLSITLTPRDANSRFYMQGEIFWLDSSNTSGWQGGYARWRRNGSVVFEPSYALELGSMHNGNLMHRNTISYLDSPATTSQLTYNIQLYNYSTTVYWHQGGGNSYLTIFEIAG